MFIGFETEFLRGVDDILRQRFHSTERSVGET